MSDYRFGDDYKLSIYPKDAMDGCGGIDMNKVEAVEIEWVDFIRKPDDNSRWHELFGTPERAAWAMVYVLGCRDSRPWVSCEECPILDGCKTRSGGYDALLEWLKGDA